MGKKNHKNSGRESKTDKMRNGKNKIVKESVGKKIKHISVGEKSQNMTNLFKIVPEHDDFAALGYDHSE